MRGAADMGEQHGVFTGDQLRWDMGFVFKHGLGARHLYLD
jgi:hypothetical protein